jgi:prepilin-type N-terminal cleavage/methylation domain-containing protein
VIRARRQRGYTAVELLMAISIFAIGVSGIIAMEKVTVSANQHAKQLAIATHIAEAWLDQLNADAALWNHPSPGNTLSDITDAQWLSQAAAGNNTGWFRPAYSAQRTFGAGFDLYGSPLSDAQVADQVYCTHIRLTWLYPETAGNGLLRAEVRVFWVRDGQGGTVDGQPVCAAGTAANLIEGAGQKYHFVYQTTAIKENTAP